MDELIKKIRTVEPTFEQAKDRTPEYAFGWVDSLNAITEVVKNHSDLSNDNECVKWTNDEVLNIIEENEHIDDLKIFFTEHGH